MTSLVQRFWGKVSNDKRALFVGYVLLFVTLAFLPFLLSLTVGRMWVRILDFALI